MDWNEFFPYEFAYEDQSEAIRQSISVLNDGGFYSMEGACGTGKTITSLTAGATLLRDPDSTFRRIVITTSVKNQLDQFVSEAQSINENLSEKFEQFRGIMMVGKSDLHPYLREDIIESSEHAVDLSELRQKAVELVRADSEIPLNIDMDVGAEEFGQDTWYDRQRAEFVQRLVRNQVESMEVRVDPDSEETETITNALETAGVESPYPNQIPMVEDIVGVDPAELPDEYRGPFDPFFVGFIAQDGWLPFGFDDANSNVLTKDTLLEEAVRRGICPHESMALLASVADIIIGNYNHVFDPTTRYLTEGKIGILDSNSLLIVDEAHDLEERARNLFSSGLGRQTIVTARNDIRGALQILRSGQVITLDQDDPDVSPDGQLLPRQQFRRKQSQEILNEHDIRIDHLRILRDSLTWLYQSFLDEIVRRNLDEVHSAWGRKIESGEPPSTSGEQFSLESDNGRDGEYSDDLSEAIVNYLKKQCENSDLKPEDVLDSLSSIGNTVWEIWDHIGERDEQTKYVTHFLNRWLNSDSTTYYRELELEHSLNGDPEEWVDWGDIYKATFELYNCIPADELAEMISELGGGIFMSATLEPHDIFQDVSGLILVENEYNRPVNTATYGTPFPKKNRASFIAPLPYFTYNNRGHPTIDFDEMSETRMRYANILLGLSNTHGNILIGMPSYAEAQWAYDLLSDDEDLEKEVLLDKSSSHEETQRLLEEFWLGDNRYRILTTSLRGTVTEGVDYSGDKLHTVVVVGIPLTNTEDPRMQAVRDAYAERFGAENDFKYTFTIPGMRKARQAIGRVIRSESDVGVRLLIDQRYSPGNRNTVFPYLSTQEKNEFKVVGKPVESVELFWEKQNRQVEL